MKKKFSLGVLAAVLMALPSHAEAAVAFSLRIQGSWEYLQAGDVNAGTRAFFDWGKIHFDPPPGGLIEGGYTPIHGGYEFGGDVVFRLSDKFGIGVGAGFLRNTHTSSADWPMMVITDNPQGDGFIKHFGADTELSATALRIGLFMTLPMGKKLSFIANAGVSGFLHARYEGFEGVVLLYSGGTSFDPVQTLRTAAEREALGLGLHGGLGVEYSFFRKLAFFIEAQGRYARLSHFKGETICEAAEGGFFPTFSETGRLYYESVPLVPGAPRLIMVQSAPPAGPGGEAREAVVDFSGIGLRAGVRFNF
jgi:hypothetical protein